MFETNTDRDQIGEYRYKAFMTKNEEKKLKLMFFFNHKLHFTYP